jgi:hypothetical protein
VVWSLDFQIAQEIRENLAAGAGCVFGFPSAAMTIKRINRCTLAVDGLASAAASPSSGASRGTARR